MPESTNGAELITTGGGQLTKKQLADRESHIFCVHEAIKNAMDIGFHLAELRDRTYYLHTHPTWEAFLLDEFDVDVRYATRLIAACQTVKMLTDDTTIDVYPEVERHVRPLTGLSDKDARIVWRKVVAEHIAQGTRITAAFVEAMIVRLFPKKVDKPVDTVGPTDPKDSTASITGDIIDVEFTPSRTVEESPPVGRESDVPTASDSDCKFLDDMQDTLAETVSVDLSRPPARSDIHNALSGSLDHSELFSEAKQVSVEQQPPVVGKQQQVDEFADSVDAVVKHTLNNIMKLGRELDKYLTQCKPGFDPRIATYELEVDIARMAKAQQGMTSALMDAMKKVSPTPTNRETTKGDDQ